ncbi:hypothetical protein [Radicibacter daui]|uniref:hypothetical protein n=1 Tax=Radicibacter daui TaxID=3064829 RepID=UPI004046ABD2
MRHPLPTVLLASALASASLPALHSAAAAQQNKYDTVIRAFAENTVRQWIADPRIIAALREQNAHNRHITRMAIDTLDAQWRAELTSTSHPLIDTVLAKPASRLLLADEKTTDGLVTEIILMDEHGLNVAQSDVTTDYWQGDEAKWQKSFGAGAGAIFIDRPERDESTQTFQSQLSMTVSDPDTGRAIGAITVGISIERMQP